MIACPSVYPTGGGAAHVAGAGTGAREVPSSAERVAYIDTERGPIAFFVQPVD
jgi:hypothetical protein